MGNRSLKKGYYQADAVHRKLRAAEASGSKSRIKVMSRASMITEDCIGRTFEIHNGKDFIPVEVRGSMVGKKFGAYAPTKKFPDNKKLSTSKVKS